MQTAASHAQRHKSILVCSLTHTHTHPCRYAHTCRQVQCVVLAAWWTAVWRSVCLMSWVLAAAFSDLTPGCVAGRGQACRRGQLHVTIQGRSSQLHPRTQKSLCDVQTSDPISSGPEGPECSGLLWLWLQKKIRIRNC